MGSKRARQTSVEMTSMGQSNPHQEMGQYGRSQKNEQPNQHHSTVGLRMRGLFACILGASLWGVSGGCAQYLFAHTQITPLLMTSWRMICAGLIFVLAASVFDRAHLRALLATPRDVARAVLFGTVGLLGSQITYVIVIELTNAGTATVLQSSGTAILLAYACIHARRYPRVIEALGLALALFSIVIIATQGSFDSLSLPLAGVLWGLMNGCAVAWYLWYPQRLFACYGSFTVTGIGMSAGGLFLVVAMGVSTLVYSPAQSPFEIVSVGWSPEAIIVAGFFVVVGTFAAFALYLFGSSRIGAVYAGMIGALEPASATLVSALWLGVALSIYDIFGLFAMMAMMILTAYAS